MKNVRIPKKFVEHYYVNNQYMDHFYTKEEKEAFYRRWEDHISEEGI